MKKQFFTALALTATLSTTLHSRHIPREDTFSLQLIDAANHNNLPIAEGLIAAGVDINVRNQRGNGAIHYALTPEKQDILKLLIDKHANINLRDANGTTPLMQASLYGYYHAMRLLLKVGADVNLQDDMGHTALTYATLGDKKEAVLLLLKNKANINHKTGVFGFRNTGDTVLIIAAHQLNYPLMDLLIRAGADRSLKGKDGKTASEIVFEKELQLHHRTHN